MVKLENMLIHSNTRINFCLDKNPKDINSSIYRPAIETYCLILLINHYNSTNSSYYPIVVRALQFDERYNRIMSWLLIDKQKSITLLSNDRIIIPNFTTIKNIVFISTDINEVIRKKELLELLG